jgi:hypothetical protein
MKMDLRIARSRSADVIKSEVEKIAPGLYRIFWKESSGGGESLAAIGITKKGGRWMAPINWVEPTTDAIRWRMVERVELIVNDAST